MWRLLVLLTVLPLFAAYTYNINDPLTSINSTNWQQNGTGTADSSGLSSSSGVSLISKVAVPDGSSEYETTATLTIPVPTTNITTVVNASYFLYLKASSNAFTDASTATGTFYAFEVANPTWSNGQCTATLNGWRSINGSVSLFGTTSLPCRNGLVARAISAPSGQIYFVADGVNNLFFMDSSIASGKAGVGIKGVSSGTSIAQTQIGWLDHTPPAAVPTSAVSTSIFWNRVDMQWQGANDGTTGIGIWGYQMYRNGSYIGMRRNTTLTDATLQPNTTYTYTWVAEDWHGNYSPVTTVIVTTPPIYQGDMWRTGVRPSGNYWGSMGENIDLLSGNLNFSLPLLKANGRRFGATFALSYNSQQWRQDAGGQWKHGVDSGYGWGWKLQAGALTPLYSDYWTIAKYVFIDSAGTEYFFDQNSNGIWKSAQGGMYAEYDSNSKRLYFTDGTFWQFGSTSAGTEEDSGTAYPTLMQDTNGNQLS